MSRETIRGRVDQAERRIRDKLADGPVVV